MKTPALEMQQRNELRPARDAHIPSLDGLRAISISMVLLGHLSGTRGIGRFDFGVGDYAHLGVVVFFVISGFLITRLLQDEYARFGTVSLKRFYTRRTIRLFPACYAYLCCLGLFWVLGRLQLSVADFGFALTYTTNFFPGRSWEIGHLWSLAVEEQFYLLWPFSYLALGPKRARMLALAVVVAGPLARIGDYLFLRGTAFGDQPMFPMVADSIATGCLLALYRDELEANPFYRRLFRPVCAVGLVALAFLTNRFLAYTIVFVFGTTIINAAIAVIIHRSIVRHEDLFGRFLNLKGVAWIGVMSYSLYLWQQPFLNRSSNHWSAAFPQNIVFAFLAAVSSYYLLERPLLKLRQRLRR